MPNAVKWSSPETAVTLLSTELNSLANSTSESTGKALSGEQTNGTDRHMYADFELNLGSFGVAPSAGAYVALYVVPKVDGTNYADGSTTVDPAATMLLGTFPVRANTAAQRLALLRCLLPPLDFKILLVNKTGQSLNGSGNTLKMRRYNEEVQ